MKQIDFEHGKITDNILRASIPMLVAEVLSLLYNIVDRIYIARIPDVGTTALGAVGLCFPIITIILAFSNLFGSGGAPLFSIERGRKDTKESSMIMNTSFFLICVCALLLMAVGMIFAKPILLLFVDGAVPVPRSDVPDPSRTAHRSDPSSADRWHRKPCKLSSRRCS